MRRSIAIPILVLASALAGCRAARSTPGESRTAVVGSGLRLVVVAVDRLECIT